MANLTKAQIKAFEEEDRVLIEQVEADIEAGRLTKVHETPEARAAIAAAAAEALEWVKSRKESPKDSSITLRVNTGVLRRLKRMASKQGMRYQTFIGHLLEDVANKS